MKKLILVGFIVCLVFAGFVTATNITLNCDWYADTCSSDKIDYLKMDNYTGELNNTHAQLVNFTATNYSYHLCCNSSPTDYLKSDGARTTIMARLWNVTDTHVEEPAQSNYNFTVDIKTAIAGYPICTYSEAGCPDGFSCMYSLESDDTSNRTNAHIGDCNSYVNQVCCRIYQNITTGGTGGGGFTGSIVAPLPIPEDAQCDYDEVYFENECLNEFAVNCKFYFSKMSYQPNETAVFTFECPDFAGRTYELEWYNSNFEIIGLNKGYVGAINTENFTYYNELDGTVRLKMSNGLTVYKKFYFREGVNWTALLRGSGLYIVAFIILIIIGLAMFNTKKSIENKKRK